MQKSSTVLLILLGIFFHVFYIFSIFDIYFKSPLVHGMTPQKVDMPPPADRLVLFVADGLRADKLYQFHNEDGNMVSKAPYLRNIVLNRGRWGVSHTRVPTESRPGHVAIIAGFYEDVSAVTKGWKMNPVEFDSVFNESHHTWSFGSPDILPMFAHGASDPDRVEMEMYPPEWEDFGMKDAYILDEWVFEKVEELFDNATKDPELNIKLRQPKNIFFLHLLGLDTNGHAHRPNSPQYINNILYVDKGVQKMVNIFEQFYGDGRTAYIFTADHGMNNRGVHGDGHPDNTRTPLIAWGAGISRPNYTHPSGHDEFSAEWNLPVQRNDVNQADIAPLMSSLIGISYPLNSVGKLPLDYIESTPEFKAHTAFVNAKQILAQYQVKYASKASTELFFKPFSPLSNSTHRPEVLLELINNLIESANYDEAISFCMTLIDLCLEGLRYFQTYDWLFLRSIVSAGYIGWILFSFSFVLRRYVLSSSEQNGSALKTTHIDAYRSLIYGVALTVASILFGMIYIQSMPFMYYAYAIFPIFFWTEIAKRRDIYLNILKLAYHQHRLPFIILMVVFYIGGMQLLVTSYHHRELLSAGFILLACWPWFSSATSLKANWPLLIQWSFFCVCTSAFTMLSPELSENTHLVIAGGILIVLTGCLAFWKSSHFMTAKPSTTLAFDRFLIFAQLSMTIVSMILVWDTSASLRAKTGLRVFNQYMSWVVLGVSGISPFIYGMHNQQHYLHRLIFIWLAFAPIFILLSISYEVLFYYFFSIVLFLWLHIERIVASQTKSSTGQRSLVIGDARIALTFLFFIQVGFFGTGNIASLSTFSLESVYRLTTVFNPFLMGVLLIGKILIPFLILTSIYGVLSRILGLPPFSLFLLVLSTTDIITLNFFYQVRDDGSWLEIGTSISHFIIASLFVLFTIFLFSLSHLLVGHAVVTEPYRLKKD
ncbi:uncharacterized protein VTP21DRAFT_11050 [Calcarisporiella thermophila]|uniref:uncharacterized protein n=1 Tax=Calcarisporiella thermophila TaxID=911321 RepID=UPI003742A098